jgi:hypothetical protein
MSDIVGIEVLLHDRCRSCGTNVAVVGPRQLLCDACGIGRGLIGPDLRTFLEKFVQQFGCPDQPIVLRSGKLFRPEPPAVAAETATKRKRKGTKMKMSDLFPSRFLRAVDLHGKPRVITIEKVEHEVFKDDGTEVTKAVLHLKEKGTRPVVINKTNATMLVALTGSDDDEDWAGHRIELRSEKVRSKGGKIVDSIRVYEAPQSVKADTDLIDELDDEVIV